MTYIEYFDKEPVENICAALSGTPERIVFLGDSRKRMEKSAEVYRRVFSDRGMYPEILCRTANKNRLDEMITVLCELKDTYQDCVYDATGGSEMYLVGLGIVYERNHGENITIQKTNINSDSVLRMDSNGWSVMKNVPSLSVEENIQIFGGRIIYEDEMPLGTFQWSWSPEFVKDVEGMWEVCRTDTRKWNQQIMVLEAAEKHKAPDSATLTTDVSVDVLVQAMDKSDLNSLIFTDVLSGLIRIGMIEEFREENGMLRITYKDAQIKRCLTKAGLVLELKVFLAAQQTLDTDGKNVYQNVMTGVCIDWDGQVARSIYDSGAQNEVDVIAMHGMIPVFISCKNGMVEVGELYKLYSVAESFGGRYAKKVLIVNGLDVDSDYGENIRQRAEELGIRMVVDFPKKTREEIARMMRSLWRG